MERKQSIFFKKLCFFLKDDTAKVSVIAESLRSNGIQSSFVDWPRFAELINEEVVMILICPSLSQPELQPLLLKREEENGKLVLPLRLIVLSDEALWKGYNVNYYLHVLPVDTQIDEIKRQYFQMASYLSNKSGFFANLLKPRI